ncbi:MAG: hypothetical protein WAU91_01905 [Desulfatitalea sp.]
MNTMHPLSNPPIGIQRVDRFAKESDEALSALLRDVLQTSEVRKLFITIVSELLNVWAGRSRWKKKVSKLAGYTVDNLLLRPEDAFGNRELPALFENEKFIRNMAEQLPAVINGLVDAACAALANLEKFSAEDKKQLVEDLLMRTGRGRSGAFLTNCARVLNDIHTIEPEFLARILAPGVVKWLEATDFGEVKEAVDDSATGFLALVTMINTIIWQYPSKVVGIFALLPPFLKMAAGAVEVSLQKVNGLPPDLLTDIVISLLKEIDAGVAARLVNELMEIGRKLHTGSALIGEPGAPQLPKAFAAKLEEIVSEIDATTFWKGRIALAEIKAAFDGALDEAVGRHPEKVALGMSKGPELVNIRMRSRNRGMSRLESMDSESLAENMTHLLSAYDVQEGAETINNFLKIINRFWEHEPEVLAGFIGQFINAVDFVELADAAKHVFEGVGEELRPLARTILPGLVVWGCDILRPEDDENETDASRAREALRSLFLTEEV